MTEKDKADIYDWLLQMANDPCEWQKFYSASEQKLLANNALDLLEDYKWIPVDERLPMCMGNKVLVYLQHEELVDQVGYGHYEKYQGQEMWYNLETGEQFSKRGYKVTHWMPFPVSPDGSRLALS